MTMQLLGYNEAAELLRISRKTLERRVREGQIGYVKQGRGRTARVTFRPEHIEAFIQANEHAPTARTRPLRGARGRL